jgi:hypothetical protein
MLTFRRWASCAPHRASLARPPSFPTGGVVKAGGGACSPPLPARAAPRGDQSPRVGTRRPGAAPPGRTERLCSARRRDPPGLASSAPRVSIALYKGGRSGTQGSSSRSRSRPQLARFRSPSGRVASPAMITKAGNAPVPPKGVAGGAARQFFARGTLERGTLERAEAVPNP